MERRAFQFVCTLMLVAVGMWNMPLTAAARSPEDQARQGSPEVGTTIEATGTPEATLSPELTRTPQITPSPSSTLTPTAIIATPAAATPDITVLALQKQKAFLEVAKLEKETSWLWGNLVSLVTALGAVLVGLFGIWRFFQERAADREKHTDELFQEASKGLTGDHGAVMASTQALYTFLGPGYEKFYGRVFALAFSQLRELRYDPNDRNLKFRQASLSRLFCEAAKVRNRVQNPYVVPPKRPGDNNSGERKRRNFDAVGIQMQELELEDVTLSYVDLRHAQFQRTTLNNSSLKQAFLTKARMEGTKLRNVDLTGAILDETLLAGADFTGADLSGAQFINVDLNGANPEAAALLKDAVFTNVRNLSDDQKSQCVAKGARFV
ncbi:MAG TPA: pentapeptide repeat-containing protein [Chloroflexia bacterium]